MHLLRAEDGSSWRPTASTQPFTGVTACKEKDLQMDPHFLGMITKIPMPHCTSTSTCPHTKEECPHCGSDENTHAPPVTHRACPHTKEECPHCGSAEADSDSSCKYSMSVHKTQGAQSYHQDKCVTRIMSSMSDPQRCIAYMAGVSEGNADMAGCSIHDLVDICEHKSKEFTQGDAETLCTAINRASGEFWASYKDK